MQVGVQLKPPRVMRCCTYGTTAGHSPVATPGQLACSASLALVSFYRVAAPSQSYNVRPREAVSSMSGHARGCATEATTRAAFSINGRTAGHGHEAAPGQLACSASLAALVSLYRVAAP